MEQYHTLFVINYPNGDIGRIHQTVEVEPDAHSHSMILRRVLNSILAHFPELSCRFVGYYLQDNPDIDIYEARDPDGHFVMYMSKTKFPANYK